MKLLLVVAALALAGLLLYWGLHFYLSLSASRKLVERTVPFTNLSQDMTVPLLVLGDSTAVGVGANTPEESVPGRVAEALGATFVENHAVVGAMVGDLQSQVSQAKLQHYQLILIQIGANDMVRFHDAKTSAATLADALSKLPSADKIIVISAGDLGTARIFPYPLRAVYSRVNRAYHREFANVTDAYVDLSHGPGIERFEEDPKTYFAADNFHLSSEGYGLWFEAIRERLPTP